MKVNIKISAICPHCNSFFELTLTLSNCNTDFFDDDDEDFDIFSKSECPHCGKTFYPFISNNVQRNSKLLKETDKQSSRSVKHFLECEEYKKQLKDKEDKLQKYQEYLNYAMKSSSKFWTGFGFCASLIYFFVSTFIIFILLASFHLPTIGQVFFGCIGILISMGMAACFYKIFDKLSNVKDELN